MTSTKTVSVRSRGLNTLRCAPRALRVFVDSQPRFGYSGDLARCCAWGLCVATRTGWTMPLLGVGWSRPSAAGCAEAGADPAEPEPLEGQPRQFSPEQDCLDVGRNQARARFAWAYALCAWFLVQTAGGFLDAAGRVYGFPPIRKGREWMGHGRWAEKVCSGLKVDRSRVFGQVF
jgi:hypothetical protein